MSRLTAKRIRIACIVLVLVVFGGFAISKINIEPADYTKNLEEQISKAEGIFEGIDITKGEYTTKNINEFENAILAAKEVLNDSASTYSDKKEAVLMLREAIERLEKSKGVLGDFKDTAEQSQAMANNTESKENDDGSTESKSDKTNSDNKDAKENTNTSAGNSNSNTSGNSTPASQGSSGGISSTTPVNNKEYVHCTIQIDCHNLVGYEGLAANLKPYVPANGIILPKTTVKIEKGKSVFDVLNKICRDKGIQVESSFTPMYGSYYVEGINNLYEFDGGDLSGWMYKVNGWYPNYGCSEYVVKEGDVIVWSYTKDCGVDLGQPMY